MHKLLMHGLGGIYSFATIPRGGTNHLAAQKQMRNAWGAFPAAFGGRAYSTTFLSNILAMTSTISFISVLVVFIIRS